LPNQSVLHLDGGLPRDLVMLPLAERLQSAAAEAGVALELATGAPKHPRRSIRAYESTGAPAHAEGYLLTSARGHPRG
jgi:hypothetical protein